MLQRRPALSNFLLHMKEIHMNCQGADMTPRLARSWRARESLQVLGLVSGSSSGRGKGKKRTTPQ